MFVCWQNKARIFMVQVCGRVKHHYLERSEVGYLRFFIHKNKKALVERYAHNFAVPSIVVAVTYVTALQKIVMSCCAEYCLCYDCSFIRIHHQDGNY
jgi:hypothetical protein